MIELPDEYYRHGIQLREGDSPGQSGKKNPDSPY
jgi:hypothetical protein